jgi:hypothetical protein
MKAPATPWIITCIVLGLFLLFVGIMWKRDTDRDTAARRSAESLRSAMEKHLAQADTLRDIQTGLDSIHAIQYAQFEETLASLDSLRIEAEAREDEIYSMPSDSLPALVRRLVADARRLGFLRSR